MATGGGSSVAGAGVAAEAEMKLECFDFAFNSERFSDRLLRIEVLAGDDGTEGSLPARARHRKEGAYASTACLSPRSLMDFAEDICCLGRFGH